MTHVLIVGAGPAGMSAALELIGYGMSVTVTDDQPTPGGRIFAAIEARVAHGAEDRSGAALVRRFRRAGGHYLDATEVWQIEDGPRVFLTREGSASTLTPDFVVLATGAQERPMPFPGWQLPGVMTIGGAQILLKTAREIPSGAVWLAGSGPLLLLYATQLLAAGGAIAGILDTTPARRMRASARLLPAAMRFGWRDLLRGIGFFARLRKIPVVRDVDAIEALGEARINAVRYATRGGAQAEVSADHLFVHNGIIPGIHATLAARLDHEWNDDQQSFQPITDAFGASSNPSIFVAGDGATIGGARAAMLSGRLAAIGVAKAAGALSEREARLTAEPLQKQRRASRSFRRFVDTLYPPQDLRIPDATILCRCEEITAKQVRTLLRDRPYLDPDGIKIATRAGMGPCQGRQCGLSLSRLVAEVRGGSLENVGFLRVRPPLKPLTLRELAALDAAS